MILTRDVILREMAAGRLGVEPCEPDQIGPASIDLHLGNEIRVMEGGADAIDVRFGGQVILRSDPPATAADGGTDPRGGADPPTPGAAG